MDLVFIFTFDSLSSVVSLQLLLEGWQECAIFEVVGCPYIHIHNQICAYRVKVMHSDKVSLGIDSKLTGRVCESENIYSIYRQKFRMHGDIPSNNNNYNNNTALFSWIQNPNCWMKLPNEKKYGEKNWKEYEKCVNLRLNGGSLCFERIHSFHTLTVECRTFCAICFSYFYIFR